MSKKNCDLRVAIVGLGPRGLAAIEALVVLVTGKDVTLHIDGFDTNSWPGAGPNFQPNQTEHCILNIPIREVDIPPAEKLGLALGGFEEWAIDNEDSDTFPTRAKLGAYLAKRFDDNVGALPENVHFQANTCSVKRLSFLEEKVQVHADATTYGPFDEVLLAMGQPETKPDDQLAGWIAHAETSSAEVVSAYPDRVLLERAKNWAGKTVAIRGLGLSTMDVLRIMTNGLGGTFYDGVYVPSGNEPARILPFSLNGQPPVPKPLNKVLDAQFDLLEPEKAAFSDALEFALTQPADHALLTICEALERPAIRVLNSADNPVDQAEIQAWLRVERDDPGSQETRVPLVALRENIAIASADAPPDIGYTIGQLWRKIQDVLRQKFNTTKVMRETAMAVIGFDEGLKRYSYGPPLRSAQELLMLVEAGVVSLTAADDPKIETTKGGWHFSDDGLDEYASVMVDAVIASAELSCLSEPLFKKLQECSYLSSFAEGFGIATTPDGRLIGSDGSIHNSVCLLGRMALGSVIAVDSIHDCFGASADRWSNGVLSRI